MVVASGTRRNRRYSGSRCKSKKDRGGDERAHREQLSTQRGPGSCKKTNGPCRTDMTAAVRLLIYMGQKQSLLNASDGPKTPTSCTAGGRRRQLHSFCTWVSYPGSKFLVLRRRTGRWSKTTSARLACRACQAHVAVHVSQCRDKIREQALPK